MASSKFKLPEKHFCLEVCNDVADICQPLFRFFGITYFGFTRTFENGTTATLCSDSGVPANHQYFDLPGAVDAGHYIQKGLFYQRDVEGVIYPTKNAKILREAVGSDHCALLFKEGVGYTDLYFFSTSMGNENIYSSYQRNSDLLDKFTYYFEEKAESLIVEAEKNRITIHKAENKQPDCVVEKKARELFLSEVALSKYKIICKQKAALITKQETLVLHFLSRGKAIKETAARMALSPRTVEFYLKNVKCKLNYYSKSQAVDMFLQSKLSNSLDVNLLKGGEGNV